MGWENIYQENGNEKCLEVAILISDKMYLKWNTVKTDKMTVHINKIINWEKYRVTINVHITCTKPPERYNCY